MRNKDFALFLGISFAISAPLFVLSTRQTSAAVNIALFLIGSYAPALAAWFVLTRHGTDGERSDFRKRLFARAGGKWFVIAILMPSVVWLLVYWISGSANGSVKPMWGALAFVPIIVIVNYGEEIGWRGYGLPYLMERFNPLTASLILGVIWALFHAPLYLQRPEFGVRVSAVIVLLSVILAWMFINTKNILPGTIFHAVFNSWINVFLIGDNPGDMLILAIALFGVVAGSLVRRSGVSLAVTQ